MWKIVGYLYQSFPFAMSSFTPSAFELVRKTFRSSLEFFGYACLADSTVYFRDGQTVDRGQWQTISMSIVLESIFRPRARKLILVVDNNVLWMVVNYKKKFFLRKSTLKGEVYF